MTPEANEPQLVITSPRRVGRRRLSDEPMTNLCVRVPNSVYDKLAALSLKRDEPMASLVRTLLTLKVHP